MKVVILCGGLGTRLSEETISKPKPMVEIGDHPILWHIMNIYANAGFNDFVLPLGYKGDVIKDYFLKFNAFNNDFKINLKNGAVEYQNGRNLDWNIQLVSTGLNSMTGGRIKRLQSVLKNEDTFMVTYGDGLANINIKKLLEFHKSHGKVATVTAVHPPSRFGEIVLNGNSVKNFAEKPQTQEGWINGGFFVFSKKIFNYLEDDQTVLEKQPLETLAKEGQLMAFTHSGFWQCMDTLRDKNYLTSIYNDQQAPWLALE